jgi:transposase
VRATTLLNRLLRYRSVSAVGVAFPPGPPTSPPTGPPTSRPDGRAEVVQVEVRLRRRWLYCPACSYRTRARYDTRPVLSHWRALDWGSYQVRILARLRRLSCPAHGVLTEAVPFARPGAQFTRDFEALTAVLATKTDKTTIARLLRIDWDTVGRICQRVVADELDPARLDGLVHIGVDEVSWKKHHHYLTLVTDHVSGRIVWGAPGRDAATLDTFFAELGPARTAAIEAVSTDMGAPYLKSVTTNAPQATLCTDPFHVVKAVTDALDTERRRTWNDLRRAGAITAARTFRGARWALLKNPTNLTDPQATILRQIKRRGGDLWRAYTLKEAFRAIFAGDLPTDQIPTLIDRWISRAQRSRLPAFIAAAKTIRSFRHGIHDAIRLNINNGRVEGLNTVVRLITRRARGFHSPQAALALVMLTCGPINLRLPHEQPT